MDLVFLASAKSVLATLMSIVYFLVCLVLILIVLVQRGSEGGGLGGAFGGGGAESAFGVKANLAFKKTTAIVAVIFVTLSLGLAWLQRPPAPEPVPPPAAPENSGVPSMEGQPAANTGTPALPPENPDGSE